MWKVLQKSKVTQQRWVVLPYAIFFPTFLYTSVSQLEALLLIKKDTADNTVSFLKGSHSFVWVFLCSAMLQASYKLWHKSAVFGIMQPLELPRIRLVGLGMAVLFQRSFCFSQSEWVMIHIKELWFRLTFSSDGICREPWTLEIPGFFGALSLGGRSPLGGIWLQSAVAGSTDSF